MFGERKWVNENRHRLCPLLRKKIAESYRYPRWVPHFLHKPLTALKHNVVGHKVIVQLNRQHCYASLDTGNLEKTLGVRVKHRLDIIDGFSARVTIKTMRKLLKSESVAGIWHDRKVKALLDAAVPAVNAPQVWNTGHYGRGVGIAVVDTGIYPHPDLVSPTNRIIGFKDFVKNRTKPYDDNGHGTHCAGDAAGNGSKSNGKYKGPAPKANLIGVKVLDKTGSGLLSSVLAGIQWCINNKKKYGIRILSISIGAAAKVSYKSDLMCRAVEKAWDSGLVVCAAAGNNGPDKSTINSPGIDPRVITVGAVDDKNTISVKDDTVASFSSRGPTPDGLAKPDVVAPGMRIVSLRVPGSYIDRTAPFSRAGSWYTSLSGTSMATPICAGVAAIVLGIKPALTPDKVKILLMSTCRTISTDPSAQGSGLIDAIAAVKRVTS